MRLKILIYSLLAFTLVVAPAAKAEPKSTFEFLMNEPVSLLDIGIVNLTNRLHLLFKEEIGAHPHWHVDLSQNHIEIGLRVSTYDGDLSSAKTYCKEKAIYIARHFMKESERNGFAELCNMFDHIGFKNTKLTESYCQDIVSSVDVQISMDLLDGETISCNANIKEAAEGKIFFDR